MNKEEAIKIWDDIYENSLWVQDCFGTWIYKYDYADYETFRKRPGGSDKKFNYAWEVDHIRPQSDFKSNENPDFYNNYELMHYQNNRKKGNNLEFQINNRDYKIVECEICREHGTLGYGIEDVALKKRVDWKFTRRAYYGD